MYNEAFALHGSTMLFLFSVPVMEAMAMWLVPLMLGQRNLAFPRLSAFSFWLYLGGVLMLWVSHALNITPDLGWFEYPPLSGPAYSPGHRADIWAQMITFTEVAALCASVNIAATILKMRPPGMTLARIPLFLWAMLVASLMTIVALPAVMLVTSMLIADRLVATQFFAPAGGGDALLFQHLFWFFGHPEVYIIFVPAIGFVSAIVETFSRRPLFGHVPMVLSVLAIGVLAFGLWVHHMFAVGLPRHGQRVLHRGEHGDRAAGRACRCSAGSRRCGAADRGSRRRCCGSRLHRDVRDRRAVGRHDRVRAARPAADRHVLHRRAPALRADRRRRVPAASARSATGIRRRPAG